MQDRRVAQLFRLFLNTLLGRFVVAYSRCDVARFFLTPGTSNYNGRPAQKLGTVKKNPIEFRFIWLGDLKFLLGVKIEFFN
jgi:hypothetical protein